MLSRLGLSGVHLRYLIGKRSDNPSESTEKDPRNLDGPNAARLTQPVISKVNPRTMDELALSLQDPQERILVQLDPKNEGAASELEGKYDDALEFYRRVLRMHIMRRY